MSPESSGARGREPDFSTTATPLISVSDLIVGEDGGYVDVVVTLSAASSSTVTVNYATNTFGEYYYHDASDFYDFTDVSGTLSFAAGETTKSVRVFILEDDDVESLESFKFELSGASGGSIYDGRSDITIVDNDDERINPELHIRDVVVNEQEGTATFMVVLGKSGGQSSSSAVTVDYATENGTATAGSDYTATSGSLTFEAGESVKLVTVSLTNDSAAEGAERFYVSLSDASGAVIVDGQGAATIGLSDGKTNAAPVLSVIDRVVAEDNGYVEFKVSLSAPSASVVTVNYATSGVNASDFYDFGDTSGTLKFAAGETTQWVRVYVLDDLTAEGLESMRLDLSVAVNASIGTASATGTIFDNDGGFLVVGRGDSDDVYEIEESSTVIVENIDGGYDEARAIVDYTLGGQVEELTLLGAALRGTGNEIANLITGTSGANTLSGVAGNDTLDGAGGADSMIGGTGNDTFMVQNAKDKTVEGAGQGTDLVKSSLTWTLASEVENLLLLGSDALDGTGNAGNNLLTGNSAKNTLSGLAGNDTMDGADNADSMVGGTGNDTYIVQHSGDKTVEQSGQGIDVVRASLDWTLGSHVDNLVLTGDGALDGTGNGLDNQIIGNSGANALSGGDGNDTLDGGTGADTLTGGAGNDTFVVERNGDLVVEAVDGGIDTIRTSLDHTLSAEIENLTLTGTADLVGNGNGSSNALTGNEGDNTLTGAGGDDTLDGGAGADVLNGGNGNDVYRVGETGDDVNESAGGGVDRIFSTINLTLVGEVENLTLSGSGNLSGTGNALANLLVGNSGKNTLNGGSGSDTLTGGADDDIFLIASLSGSDTITDFASGNDKARISQGPIKVGDGDTAVEGAVKVGGPGGFSAAAELVIISDDITGDITASKAAAAIGSASSSYATGRTVLFVVDNGASAGLYLFTSSGNNAAVSSGELDLIATFDGTPSLAVGDFLFGA